MLKRESAPEAALRDAKPAVAATLIAGVSLVLTIALLDLFASNPAADGAPEVFVEAFVLYTASESAVSQMLRQRGLECVARDVGVDRETVCGSDSGAEPVISVILRAAPNGQLRSLAATVTYGDASEAAIAADAGSFFKALLAGRPGTPVEPHLEEWIDANIQGGGAFIGDATYIIAANENQRLFQVVAIR